MLHTFKTMFRWLTKDGRGTTETDPNRQMWYATSGKCGYWTDDWQKLNVESTVPRCPRCGCPGMQSSMKNWLAASLDYQIGKGNPGLRADENPGYVEFTQLNKEQCWSNSITGGTWIGRYKHWAKKQGLSNEEG